MEFETKHINALKRHAESVLAPFTVWRISKLGLAMFVEDCANFATALNVKDRTEYTSGTEIKIFDNQLKRFVK